MERERVKPIILTDTETGETYTLEFNRRTVVMAESAGLDVTHAQDHPISTVTKLWFYAFKMHHPTITQAKADELFDGLRKIPEKLIVRLVELYQAGIESLTDENPTVTVTL